MQLGAIQTYLLAKPQARLDFPFGEDVSVFKVKNKIFATLAIGKTAQGDDANPPWWMNLKCDPDEAVMLRDIFSSIIPGYHMNKRLWNTIILDGSIPRGEIERMIDNSFMLVVNKMTKQERQSILIHL